MGLFHTWIILTAVSSLVFCDEKATRPNIVFFIADDMGWDDVSFHGSDQVLTPNIDLLAYTGVALERYYSHCVCTPSRSALLTGKFAYKTGMHGYPLTNGEDRGLPTTEKILPQYLKDLGYATHLVGKWHVGRSRTKYLPTSRGFDTYFGHKGGSIDYYEYTAEEYWDIGQISGLDLTRNSTPAWDVEGYITDVYNAEANSIIASHNKSSPLFLMVAYSAPHAADNAAVFLQAPPEEVRAMRHVESPQRRIYSAMVKKLDDSIGDTIEALLKKEMLDNTIIVFISDNGGMTSGLYMNYASNWPLRGIKFSPFEGGVRVVGSIWTPKLNVTNHLWKGYMHIVDWLPTLLGAIGSEPPSNIDGVDLWDSITSNRDSKRHTFFEIDDDGGFHSIVSGDYKLVTGNVNKNFSNHQGADMRGVIGLGPSYEDTIKHSKMYSVLKGIGKPFKFEDTDLRYKIRVECKGNVNNDKNICYPSASTGTVCLYNIKEDPCETKDLSNAYPAVVQNMLNRLNIELLTVVPRLPIVRDPKALPKLFNYTWSPWADNLPTPHCNVNMSN